MTNEEWDEILFGEWDEQGVYSVNKAISNNKEDDLIPF
jgi:hypothetical protein